MRAALERAGRMWKKYLKMKFSARIFLAFLVAVPGGLIGGTGLILYWQTTAVSGAATFGSAQTLPPVYLEVRRRLLDGLPASSTETRRPFAVTVENHVDARPLSGISRASLVFEAPVEGGITRLLAFYEAESEVPEIGPVRSARPYFLDWTGELDALYAHVGGSPAALSAIKAGVVRDLDEYFWGAYFWRASSRSAPHNVYTSSDLLRRAEQKRGADQTVNLSSWQFAATSTPLVGSAAEEVVVPFSTRDYKVKWRWEPQLRAYRRFLADSPDRDALGDELRAANVAIIFVRTRVLDEVGRLALGALGAGRAIIFKDSQAEEGSWSKDSTSERLRFKNQSGEEIRFRPGATWVEVVPEGISVSYGASENFSGYGEKLQN